MKIGIVLSRPPGYSETFFRNKIIGLLEKGITVELYVEHYEDSFNLCKQIALPELYSFSTIVFFVSTFISKPGRVWNFIRAEFSCNHKPFVIVRNLYSSLHLLNSNGLDWVHFGFATMGVGRENIAKVLNAKMAISLRGFDISRYPLKHSGVYNLLWKKVDKVHTISNALLLKAFNEGLSKDIRHMKITPAIDTHHFVYSVVRSKPVAPVQFLTVARLHWSKGLEFTLTGLAELQHAGIDFHFTIIGEGSEIERLTLAARDLEISDKVTFVGKVDHTRLKPYYEKADIYLQFSIQEGFCNAVLEAQAMGLLCIVSDAEGLPENVLNNETGWVVERRNSTSLAKKIVEVINMEDNLQQQIRKLAIERLHEKFNLEKQRSEFVAFYRD